MTKKYKAKIEGKNFICKRGEYVISQKKYVGNNMKHSGIWYDHENRTVYLSSDSMADIYSLPEYGVWEHTRRPNQTEVGYKAVVLPSEKAIEEAKKNNVPISSVEFEITKKPYRVSEKKAKSWPSQNK